MFRHPIPLQFAMAVIQKERHSVTGPVLNSGGSGGLSVECGDKHCRSENLLGIMLGVYFSPQPTVMASIRKVGEHAGHTEWLSQLAPMHPTTSSPLVTSLTTIISNCEA